MLATFNTTRPTRVLVLLLTIALLSMLDLGLTVGFMSSGGMYESNPVARVVANWTGSSLGMAGFKLCSLALAGAILLPLRRRFTSELGAWIGLGLLVFVTVNWALYLDALHGIDPAQLAAFNTHDSSWITLQ